MTDDGGSLISAGNQEIVNAWDGVMIGIAIIGPRHFTMRRLENTA